LTSGVKESINRIIEDKPMTSDEAFENLMLQYRVFYEFLLYVIDPENREEFEYDGEDYEELMDEMSLGVSILEEMFSLDSLVGDEKFLAFAELSWAFGNFLLVRHKEATREMEEFINGKIEEMKAHIGSVSMKYNNIEIVDNEVFAPIFYQDGGSGIINSKYTLDKKTGKITFNNSQLQKEYNGDGGELYYIEGKLIWESTAVEIDLKIVVTYAME